MKPSSKKIDFQDVLDALMITEKPFPPAYLREFSNLTPEHETELAKTWPLVPVQRRRAIFQDLEDLAEADTLVILNSIAMMGLEDPDPDVRTLAIRLMWEDNNQVLANKLLTMVKSDPDVNVRAGAATGLGAFVYWGEVQEISEDLLNRVVGSLLEAAQGQEEKLVRRRALESLGFSSHEAVPDLIETAYENTDPDWIQSALFAMGRSADERWREPVLARLDHPRTDIQAEAITAAGELGLKEANNLIVDILEDTEDADVWAAAVWALSKIGGDNVRAIFEEMMEEAQDDEEVMFLEEAIENLAFSEDIGSLDLFDLTLDEDDLPDENNGKKPK